MSERIVWITHNVLLLDFDLHWGQLWIHIFYLVRHLLVRLDLPKCLSLQIDVNGCLLLKVVQSYQLIVLNKNSL